jgi:hypothetical protein
MKKMILMLVVFCFVCTGLAYAVDTRGLDEEQQAELALQAARMKKGSVPETVSTPQKVNEWVQVGNNVGTALISAAEKLGQTADKFLESKTGKITIVLIVWKMMGSVIIHVGTGIAFWVVSTIILIWLFRKTNIKSIEKTHVDGKLFRNKKITYNSPGEMEETRVTLMVLWVAATAVSIFMIFSW